MRKIGVGIIGMGVAGSLHAASYAAIPDKAGIVAICDRNEKALKTAVSVYGGKAYTDYHELIARNDIEAVDVCLPHWLHAEATVAAAEAGKHVLVEKPISTTLEDADRIIGAARKAGVKLMVAENHRFTPAHRLAKELVNQGKIGRIFAARAYELCNDVPTDPGGWKARPEAMGALLDMGVHKFNVLRWIVGEVESVFAVARKLVCSLQTDIDDNAVILLEFANGALGEVFVTSSVVHEPTNRLELYGTEGTIIEEHSWKRPLMYYSQKAGRWVRPRVEHAPFPGYYEISFKKEVEHFVDCILQDRQPEVTGEDGKAALKLALAAYKSAKTGKIQRVG